MRSWCVDRLTLGDAADYLGLAVPVDVDVRAKENGHCGEYHGWGIVGGVWRHLIKLNRLCCLEEAEHSLWHELGHAAQLERLYREEPKAREMGRGWAWAESQRRYRREFRKLGISATMLDADDYDVKVYLRHSEEYEAEVLAERMVQEWPGLGYPPLICESVPAAPAERRLVRSELFG